MKIFLIRHGSTAGNLEGRYVGSTDESLTPEAKKELLRKRAFYPKADAVFVSPLKRCRESAEILFPDLHKTEVKDFREIDFGDFEYKTYEELKDDKRYQDWINSGGILPFPGGESRGSFGGRCCDAFASVVSEAKTAGYVSIALIVHGGTIMAILDCFSSPHRDYYDWQIDNAEGFSCTLSDDGYSLTDIGLLPEAPALTGVEELSVTKQNRKLRMGYTSGSCAAAASKAAAAMLLSGRIVHRADLLTPKGIPLHLPVEEQEIGEHFASCAVRKYAGDDPDVTDNTPIFSRVEYTDASPDEDESAFVSKEEELTLILKGGKGVGKITKPGLEQPPGFPAINRVPREMIFEEVKKLCEDLDYKGKLLITISVPEGEKIAGKTFNPQLGIKGGISILGTSGIVEPMSEEALLSSIRLEMRQKLTQGPVLLVTQGNYGTEFIGRDEASLKEEQAIKCSNYVGESLDMAVELGAEAVLFVAHIGKFIKLTGGIMNTHSARADCRAELFAAQAARAGADFETVKRLLSSNTSEEAVAILEETGFLDATVKEILERIQFYLKKRCKGALRTELVLFSTGHGFLGETSGAKELIRRIAEEADKE